MILRFKFGVKKFLFFITGFTEAKQNTFCHPRNPGKQGLPGIKNFSFIPAFLKLKRHLPKTKNNKKWRKNFFSPSCFYGEIVEIQAFLKIIL
jgi:hypothetical protein